MAKLVTITMVEDVLVRCVDSANRRVESGASPMANSWAAWAGIPLSQHDARKVADCYAIRFALASVESLRLLCGLLWEMQTTEERKVGDTIPRNAEGVNKTHAPSLTKVSQMQNWGPEETKLARGIVAGHVPQLLTLTGQWGAAVKAAETEGAIHKLGEGRRLPNPR